MSYTKTVWRDGDVITAVKMNKIENGIESSLSDALVTLGKALCGDSFEVKPGLTDAETIMEIAKNYTGGSGSGDNTGSGLPEIVFQLDLSNVDPEAIDENLIENSILITKEEAINMALQNQNCVICLDVVDPNHILVSQLPGYGNTMTSLQNGMNYGPICKLYYEWTPSKVEGQPNDTLLSATPYIINLSKADLIPLLYYGDTMFTNPIDIWENSEDLAGMMSELMMLFARPNANGDIAGEVGE